MNMDARTLDRRIFRRKSRTLAAVVVTAALVLGVPVTAYAFTAKNLGFSISNDDFVTGIRVPASKSQDYYMPATTNGVFVMDGYGCPSGRAAFNANLRRNVAGFPDDLIVQRSLRDFCALQLNVAGLDWKAGYFHFGVAPSYYPQPAGVGMVGTRW